MRDLKFIELVVEGGSFTGPWERGWGKSLALHIYSTKEGDVQGPFQPHSDPVKLVRLRKSHGKHHSGALNGGGGGRDPLHHAQTGCTCSLARRLRHLFYPAQGFPIWLLENQLNINIRT